MLKWAIFAKVRRPAIVGVPPKRQIGSPPQRAYLDDGGNSLNFSPLVRRSGGSVMKRCQGTLVLVIVLAWTAPAPAQLFAKKVKPNPSQRVPELILIYLKTDPDEKKRAHAAEEIRDYDAILFAEIVPVLVDVLQNDKKMSVRHEAVEQPGEDSAVSMGWRPTRWNERPAVTNRGGCACRRRQRSRSITWRAIRRRRNCCRPRARRRRRNLRWLCRRRRPVVRWCNNRHRRRGLCR